MVEEKKIIIIVESLKGYEIYKKIIKEKYPQGNFIWASLSGHILKKIDEDGEDCIHLENLINKKEVEIIDYHSKKISLQIIDLLNKYFLTNQQLTLSNATRHNFSSVVFVAFYKSYILSKIQDNNLYGKIVCVGKKQLLLDNDLYLNFSHFDTIFSLIFSQSKEYSENVIDDKISLEEINHRIQKKKNNKLSSTEKIISILEKNSNEIIFKIFQKLNFEGFYNKFIATNKKKPVIIYGENDIISNIFYSILKNRNKIYFKKRLIFKLSKIKFEQDNQDKIFDEVIKKINNELKENISPIKDLISNFFEPSLKLILKKYLFTFNLIDKNQIDLKKKFEKHSKNFSNSIVLTNGFYSIPEKMFYQFYKEKFDNKTIFFSHGVTIGINRKSLDNLGESMINFSDEIVLFDYVSYYFLRKLKTNKKMYISGIPQKNLFFKKFFKYLIKQKLKLKNKKVIILVVESEKNNSNHSSKYENDKVFYENIKKRVKYLKKNYPNHLILLKLYPNQCFFDEYDFDELKKDNKNLLILKYFEFRWLAYIADIIFSSTYESTPQHILQSGCEYYQFEDSNNDITNFIKISISKDFYIFKKKWLIREFDNNLFKKLEKIQ
jgi:hypothetical protein